MTERPPITPSTRVAALLVAYPELEETLIGIAPAFAKLRNPVLRRTIAKVTSLRRAAEVAGLPVKELVSQLRAAAGIADVDDADLADEPSVAALQSAPAWSERVVVRWTLDADALLGSGREPLGEVARRVAELVDGTAGVIESSFRPAPLLEWLATRGCETACVAEDGAFRTWVRVSAGDT